MEPSTKRRKLAPKVVTSADPKPQQHNQAPGHGTLLPNYPIAETPFTPERNDIESFARHLQDAAMLIQRQAEQAQYSHVSVLLLTWEEDVTRDPDLAALETLLHSTYHYRTQRWQIPLCPNPSIKLGVQIASFLDTARPDHLLIIYYAGHGFTGSDGQLYWARNDREDSAKLKWDGVSCLFEDAQSDMLLLLDTCAVPDPTPSGSHGVKQAIASCASGPAVRTGTASRFTANLVKAFQKLAGAGPFSTRRLYDELLCLHHDEAHQGRPPTGLNGSNIAPDSPIFFTMTPGKPHNLTLTPISARSPVAPSPSNGAGLEPDGQAAGRSEEQYINPAHLADIKFDEARILVCTTFVGDAGSDMSNFHRYLQNATSTRASIAVEGIFLGSRTLLLISMPHSVWNVIRDDNICSFLGDITSHNMLHLYQTLTGPAGPKPSAKQAEEALTRFDERHAAPAMPSQMGQERDPRELPRIPLPPPEAQAASDRPGYPTPVSSAPPSFLGVSPGAPQVKPKDENEGTEEMREAAEQLKALSHVRSRSDEGQNAMGRQRTSLPNGILDHNLSAPRGAHGIAVEASGSPAKPTSPSRVKVPRHAVPKNETRCDHCTHAPFRDSSSLRKHIAAAHTRPFPCAFSFAGCGSTFGSKNEWKRHIASQHLCLQYYRCSACSQPAAEGRGNEFNRKDLFTQHLRRMHAPFQIKNPGTKDSKIQEEWEQQVKSMQESCLVTRRRPPQKCACPRPECQNVFEGPGAWDEWTEHVGRHMEKSEAANLGVDQYLVDWAHEEGIIAFKPGGGHRLCYSNGNGTQHGSSFTEGGSFSESKESNSQSFTEPSQAASSTQEVPPAVAPAVEMEVDK